MQRFSGFSAAEEAVSANGVKGWGFLVAMVIQRVFLSWPNWRLLICLIVIYKWIKMRSWKLGM